MSVSPSRSAMVRATRRMRSVGDEVTVTYTGELSVVDAFEGEILSVAPAE